MRVFHISEYISNTETPMSAITGDPTADFLIRQIRLLKRVGSPQQKASAPKWEQLVMEHAEPMAAPHAVNFATAETAEAGT